MFYGSTIIPFKDKFDKTLKLYSLMTTKPEEVEARKQKGNGRIIVKRVCELLTRASPDGIFRLPNG